jgi:hypothetical protein
MDEVFDIGPCTTGFQQPLRNAKLPEIICPQVHIHPEQILANLTGTTILATSSPHPSTLPIPVSLLAFTGVPLTNMPVAKMVPPNKPITFLMAQDQSSPQRKKQRTSITRPPVRQFTDENYDVPLICSYYHLTHLGQLPYIHQHFPATGGNLFTRVDLPTRVDSDPVGFHPEVTCSALRANPGPPTQWS